MGGVVEPIPRRIEIKPVETEDEEHFIQEDDGTPILSEAEKLNLPEMKKMFPHLDRLVEEDRKLVNEFYKTIVTKWYSIKNNEPIRNSVFHIELKEGSRPYRTKPRRYSELDRKFLEQWVSELLERGWIKKNPSSQWAAPVVVVGGKRGVVDLRRLNQATVQTAYPLQASQLKCYRSKMQLQNIYTSKIEYRQLLRRRTLFAFDF